MLQHTQKSNYVCCALSVVLLRTKRDNVYIMSDLFTKQFGLLVKQYREVKGFSQEELANKANLHRTQISLVERGMRSVRLSTLEKLATALEIQPSKLMPDINKPK